MSNKLALSDEILMTIEKPARYIGNEVNMVRKDLNQIDIRFVMCFPDVYEIGMSHLGIQILYDMFNKREDTYCERVYSPWPDLHKIMKEQNIPLFALESQDPISSFDFLGITIQYEMCYTNILQILDLSQIAIYSKDRKEEDPIVIGGGPCTYNPEPLADFFDLFYMGEGEVVYDQLLDLYKEKKAGRLNRKEFLEEAALIPGIYVPSLYEVSYREDQTIKERIPLSPKAPETVTKQLVLNMSEAVYPTKPLVPYIKVTQDRVVLEIQRGCIRGCRFCQAGMIYRPVRERNVERLKYLAKEMLRNTGHEEISLSSLSSSDYSELKELVYFLIDEFQDKKINISLPSLRIDAFSLDVMSKVQDIKKSSLTFAPEGGTQRMRNVINKGLTEDIILEGAMKAFQGGWNKVKLYFMLGQPFEEVEDVEGIALLCERIAEEYYTIPKSERNGKVAITASASFFVPKPFTPFQWARMNTGEEFLEKAKMVNSKMKEQLNKKSMKFNWHDSKTSVLEGVFARGDRRLSKLIYDAYQKGCIFDAWSEHFKPELWDEAIEENGIDVSFYTTRERSEEEVFPWDFIDIGVTKKFLYREWQKAKEGEITKNCRMGCSGCGVMKFGGGVCFENKN